MQYLLILLSSRTLAFGRRKCWRSAINPSTSPTTASHGAKLHVDYSGSLRWLPHPLKHYNTYWTGIWPHDSPCIQMLFLAYLTPARSDLLKSSKSNFLPMTFLLLFPISFLFPSLLVSARFTSFTTV